MTIQLSTQNLALYNLQKPFVEPMLHMCRLTNTALDILFYDVGVLTAALWAKGTAIKTGGATDGTSSPAHPLQDARPHGCDEPERLHHRRERQCCALCRRGCGQKVMFN
jgi:hypothetical protein